MVPAPLWDSCHYQRVFQSRSNVPSKLTKLPQSRPSIGSAIQEFRTMNSEPVPVTREGLERLKEELAQLREVRRPEIAAIVAEARSHGDLRENSAYDAARHDQMMNEKRISDLESLLRSAEIMEEGGVDTGDVV